jgi:predicted RNA-binding protein YlqC (UPF0109 family)
MKVKILKSCGIGGTHVSADDIIDVTKEDANTLFGYGLAVEPADDDLLAGKKGKRGGE